MRNLNQIHFMNVTILLQNAKKAKNCIKNAKNSSITGDKSLSYRAKRLKSY